MWRGAATSAHGTRYMPHRPSTDRVRSYTDLKVWQAALRLVEETCRLSRRFPLDERYGLTRQMRRAAVSVPSNIAEGAGRDHLGDYLYCLSVARGSLQELETQARIAHRLGYVTSDALNAFLQESDRVGRLLSGLRRGLLAVKNRTRQARRRSGPVG